MANQTIKEQVMEVLSDPMNLPSVFWDYATQSWLKDAPVFPISQVFGFTQFTVQAAPTIAAIESTGSVTYINMTTTGPTISGLPAGQYVVFYGALITNSVNGADSLMSIDVNGGGASDNDLCDVQGNGVATFVSASRATTKTLSSPTNTITAKYRVSAGVGTFSNRWLIALKYANV